MISSTGGAGGAAGATTAVVREGSRAEHCSSGRCNRTQLQTRLSSAILHQQQI